MTTLYVQLLTKPGKNFHFTATRKVKTSRCFFIKIHIKAAYIINKLYSNTFPSF